MTSILINILLFLCFALSLSCSSKIDLKSSRNERITSDCGKDCNNNSPEDGSDPSENGSNPPNVVPDDESEDYQAVVNPSLTGTHFNSSQTLELTTGNNKDRIYYTLDGSEPTKDSTLYTGSIPINSSTTVKSFVISEDGRASAVTIHNFVIDDEPPVAAAFAAESEKSSDKFKLNWNAASDNEQGQLSYYICSGPTAQSIDSVAKCMAETKVQDFTSGLTSYTVTGKDPETTYYYNVIVRDLAGNMDIFPGFSVTTDADTVAPVVGSFAPSTNVTDSGFTLNWEAAVDNHTAASQLQYFLCSGDSEAEIDDISGCEGADKLSDYAADFKTFTVSTLKPSTTYYFNVIVKDAAGNKKAYSPVSQTTGTDATAPTAGSFGAAGSVTETGFVLNWTAATDNGTTTANLKYMLCSGSASDQIDNVAKCEGATVVHTYTANKTDHTVTSKTADTTYYYNVVVQDEAGLKTAYTPTSVSTIADTTNPVAGTFSATTDVSSTGFTLNWSAATDNYTGANQLTYRVCSGTSAAAIDTVAECMAQTMVQDFTAELTTLAITGKSPSTTYYYNVIVKDAAGNQGIYPGVSATTVADTVDPTPGSVSATTGITETSFTLNWTAGSDDITGAANLQYFVCSGANAAAINTVAKCLAASPQMTYTTAKTSLLIEEKTPNTTYYFNIVVKDAAGNEALYSGVSVTTLADTTAPVVGSFAASTGVTSNGFTLNWSAASDDVSVASELRYLVCSGASASAINSVEKCVGATIEMAYAKNTTSYEITGKDPDTEYYFNVVVKDEYDNLALYEGKTQKTDVALIPSCPTNWILVPEYTDADISVPAFCVMKYEARNVGNVATSQPSGVPWMQVYRGTTASTAGGAWKHCRDLGGTSDLISNLQWQSIARQIETAQSPPGNYLNWSTGNWADSTSFINTGHTDMDPGEVLASSTDDDPCFGVQASGDCTNKLDTSSFAQKRTHILPNGEIIWDFAGNLWEWVKDDVSFDYDVWDYYWYMITAAAGNTCLTANGCNGPQGKLKAAFGPVGDHSTKGDFTYYVGGLGVVAYLSQQGGAIMRGGQYSWGEGSVFSANFVLNPTQAPGDAGFRCVSTP